MKNLILAATVVGGLLLVAGDALGHGGSYRGPGDTIPPGQGAGPGTGGPSNGGPTTPGGVGPTTPGPGRGPTTPGAGPSAPGGGAAAPRGPVTGGGMTGKKNKPAEGFEQWQFWWENNKDRYLDLKERLGSGVVQSGSAGFLGGMGRKEVASSSNRPTPEEVNQRIVPVLRSVLGEDDADIVDSAVLAMGRMVRSDSAELVLDDIKGALQNTNATVQQSAILALGVLGSKEAIPTLIEIMNDTQEGRTLLKERNGIQALPRAFAAISLGYIGSAETIDALKKVVEEEDNSEIDLRASAVLALGLFNESQEDIVQFLVEQLKDKKMDRIIRAQIPVTLGRIGVAAEPAVPQLLKIVRGRKTDIRMQESCVIALGMLAKPEDSEVIENLMDVISEGKNEQSRHFAFISLAQIGGRAAADPEAHAEVLKKTTKFLMKELTKPKRKTHYPWAGLSLALLGREYSESVSARVTMTTKIMEAFSDSNNPSHKSGFAIALGLLNARPAGEMLYEELLDTHETNLKGYIAVSLGMMRYTESLDTLRTLVLDNKDAKMRLQMATALGLMGDVEAVNTLVEALRGAKTLSVISSMAKALGLIGDKSAIQPLEDLVKDTKAPDLARAFGCVAIGLIGEKTNLPWNEPLSANTNYRTVVPALYEILDIL